MSRAVKALIAVVVGLVAAPAGAQLFPTWETHITLTQQDLDMIHNAVTNEVHGKAVGTTAAWSNLASGKFGNYQARQEIDVERAAVRGGRIYSAHEGPARLYRVLPFHQLLAARRHLENLLSPKDPGS